MPCPQNPPLDPLLSQINLFYILVIDISEIHFNVVLRPAPLSSVDVFQQEFYICFVSRSAWFIFHLVHPLRFNYQYNVTGRIKI
jgi:hypothetical protein